MRHATCPARHVRIHCRGPPTPRPQVPRGAEIVDASGMYVMPGGIDPHTHLDMPFMGDQTCDDFERYVRGWERGPAVGVPGLGW